MVLVMTATVQPAKVKNLSITDAKTRLEQYCTALRFYSKCKKFNKIIYCDGSNYPYEYEKERQIAEKKKVQLEILKFESNCELVEKYGKGYGEGEILEYVIRHSRLLEEEDYFYKVTGRLIVKNIAFLVRKSNRTARFNRNFYAYMSLDTRFWGVRKEDFTQFLLDSYKKVNDGKGKYLEVCYKRELDNRVEYRPFCAFPVIKGYSGTAGDKYSESKWYTKPVLDLMCLLDLYNSEPGFMIAYILYYVVIEKKKLVDVYYEYLVYNTN